MTSNGGMEPRELSMVSPHKQAFYCQQAHGSVTGLISGFANVKELFQKIADYYDFPVEEILFCTRNTHSIDMKSLIGSELCFDDFIFIHLKGVRKEVELTKLEGTLGLILTDNGNGYTFIKGIQKGSLVGQCKEIQIGDHIEKIDDKSLVCLGHAEVVNYVKSIPTGNKFVMHLVEPLKTPDDVIKCAMKRIDGLVYDFMELYDAELSTKLYAITLGKKNPNELAAAVDSCELEHFGFSDDFLIELWGILSDAKAGRLAASVEKGSVN